MDVTHANLALKNHRFSRISWVDETASTNEDLMNAARDDEPEQILGADFQTSGRGRNDRVWHAAPGSSLLLSILVRPKIVPSHAHYVSWSLGLAALEATRFVGAETSLKWPNDIVVNPDHATYGDKKLGGMLAESHFEGAALRAIVLGIGLNIDNASLPDDIAPQATSLETLTEKTGDRTEFLVALVAAFEAFLEQVETTSGRLALHDLVVKSSATIGRPVRVVRANDELVGDAVGITESGRLRVQTRAEEVEVTVGDVIHLRNA